MIALILALSLNVRAEGWDGFDDPAPASTPKERIKYAVIRGEGEAAILEIAVSSPLHGDFTYRIPVSEATGRAGPGTGDEKPCRRPLTEI